jgi:hypothetical protein
MANNSTSDTSNTAEPVDPSYASELIDNNIWSDSWTTNYSWTYNQSAISEAEQELGSFSDEWGYTSYPCIPATLINIPEAKSVEAKFTYKYYTRDERTNATGENSAIDVENMTQGDLYIAKNLTSPRYVQLSIGASTYTDRLEELQGVKDSLGPNAIKDNISKVQAEEAIAASYFASVFLKDNQVDQVFYNSLSSSVSFFGLTDATSGAKQADEIASVTGISPSFSPSGVQLRKSLGNIQSQGVAYAPSDMRSEESSSAFSSVRHLSFGSAINNKLAYNVLLGSVEEKSSIYEDEMESLISSAKEIQSQAISAAIPGLITSAEFDVEIAGTISEEYSPIDNTAAVTQGSLPIGYIIEKYELTRDLNGNTVRKDYPPMIFEEYDNAHIVDQAVKYGAAYIYNIRTVCLTKFEAYREDDADDVQDQSVTAIIMAASEGLSVKVDCHENIPPGPPQNLRFHWDYQDNRLMLFWEEELNPQRDVVRYQIFRRSKVSNPFTLIKEFNFDMSASKVVPLEIAPPSLIKNYNGPRKVFKDLEFTKQSSYIYTLASVDARGLSSNYSSQFRVSWDSFKNKIKVDLVSRSNAPKPYPNLYLKTDLFVDTMKDSGNNSLTVYFDPEYYDVFNEKISTEYVDGTMKEITTQDFVKLIANNYKLQIINVDSQQSKVLNINIENDFGEPDPVPVNDATSSTFGYSEI